MAVDTTHHEGTPEKSQMLDPRPSQEKRQSLDDVIGIVLNNVSLDYFDAKAVRQCDKSLMDAVTHSYPRNKTFSERIYVCLYDNIVNMATEEQLQGVKGPSGIKIVIKGKTMVYYTKMSSLFMFEEGEEPDESLSMHLLSTVYEDTAIVGFARKGDNSKVYWGDNSDLNVATLYEARNSAGSIRNVLRKLHPRVKDIDIYYYNINKVSLNSLIEQVVKLFSDHLDEYSINLHHENVLENMLVSP